MEEREFCFVLWGKPFSLRKRSRPSLVLPDRAHQKWLLDGCKEGQPASPPLMVCGEYGGRSEKGRFMLVHRARSECVLVREGGASRGRGLLAGAGRAGETELARSLNQPDTRALMLRG